MDIGYSTYCTQRQRGTNTWDGIRASRSFSSCSRSLRNSGSVCFAFNDHYLFYLLGMLLNVDPLLEELECLG